VKKASIWAVEAQGGSDQVPPSVSQDKAEGTRGRGRVSSRHPSRGIYRRGTVQKPSIKGEKGGGRRPPIRKAIRRKELKDLREGKS